MEQPKIEFFWCVERKNPSPPKNILLIDRICRGNFDIFSSLIERTLTRWNTCNSVRKFVLEPAMIADVFVSVKVARCRCRRRNNKHQGSVVLLEFAEREEWREIRWIRLRKRERILRYWINYSTKRKGEIPEGRIVRGLPSTQIRNFYLAGTVGDKQQTAKNTFKHTFTCQCCRSNKEVFERLLAQGKNQSSVAVCWSKTSAKSHEPFDRFTTPDWNEKNLGETKPNSSSFPHHCGRSNTLSYAYI